MAKGKIIRHKDHKLGIYVHHIEYFAETNTLEAKVCYFPMDLIGNRKGWANNITRDNKFIIPKQMFLEDYRMLANPDEVKKGGEAKWVNIPGLKEV